MAYAKLANLDVQYGLYSAFMGVLIYWFFATSKDITIGPVAVMSTLVGTIVDQAAIDIPQYPGHQVASVLAVIAGSFITAMGFLRLGFVVDFISATAVSAFITGSAINIAVGQVPNLLGINKTIVNNRGRTYWVVIHTLEHLGSSKIDAALGFTALTMLYLYRYICNFLARKYPQKAKMFFLISTLRTAFVILLYTLISWAAQSSESAKIHASKGAKASRWAILGPVPRGFTDTGAPPVNITIIKAFASELPATIIVLLIEHIAIAKSFGRINNYVINPSQELLAIGITNLLGPFLSAYPATGSFSRTAIKSKAGVRTPLAGVITAIVVLLAIYALPAVFFWIPNSVLAAVIIHAVGDLILAPNTVYQFWRISPLEVFIFFAGVIVTVFSSIENGIYVTVAVSAGLLLFRLAKARGRFLGKVKVHSVVGNHNLDAAMEGRKEFNVSSNAVGGSTQADDDANTRNIYLPMNHLDGSNPSVEVQRPYPGVFIYRFSEGFNYPNANHYMDHLTQTILAETRKTNPFNYARPGDRPWNDPGPKKGQETKINTDKPTLKAVVLDFSSVNNVDVTVVQTLIDVRNQLDRHAAPDPVEWHIACVNNRWTKRALVAGGFGYPTVVSETGEIARWKPVYSVAEIGGAQSAAAAAEQSFNEAARARHSIDVETGLARDRSPAAAGKHAVVHGLNRPFFHLDVSGAVHAAVSNLQRRELSAPVEEKKLSESE